MSKNHKWTKPEDVASFYVERHGLSFLPVNSVNQITSVFGMSSASFAKRMANFRYLDGRGGLSKAAKQSQAVYAEFKALPETTVRAMVIQALRAA